jgi:outer membrane biosynthesis protein TonB
VTELAAPQISSLMEALPGIAAVLRSPVANAMVALSRSAAGLEEFQLAHAEELLRFGVRRNLLTPEEVDKVLDELREVMSRRPAKPVLPVAKKSAVTKPDAPKVPHRPKGIQLKPVPKHPPVPVVAAKPKPTPAPKPAKKVATPRKATIAKVAPSKTAPRTPVAKAAAKKVVHQKPTHHKQAHRNR